jgi:maleylpyruvate isomerase
MSAPSVLAAPADMATDVVELRLRLEDALRALTDEQVAVPSPLPGWTRGHVLAHIAGVGSAVARQLEHARAGRLVEFYDGGMPGRDAAIEAVAGAPAADHARSVLDAALRVESAFAAMGAHQWDVVTGHRSRSALAVAHTWWRELAIHLTDLDLGVTSDVWSPVLREHLVAYLAPRVPAGTCLVLAPTDTAPTGHTQGWRVGSGAEVTVRGAGADLVAMLAGREPREPLVAESAGVVAALPELGPWP